MKKRTIVLGAGFLAIILAIAPASAKSESGNASGTVEEDQNSTGVAMIVGDAWNVDGLSCWVPSSGENTNVLYVWAADPPADPPNPPYDFPADCEIEFQVLLANGVTQGGFNFELDVRLDAPDPGVCSGGTGECDNDGECTSPEFCEFDWVCTLVRWKTFQPGQPPQESPVTPKGLNQKLILIGANAPPPSPIPALGEWGMIFLGIGVVLTAVLLIRRRSAAQRTDA